MKVILKEKRKTDFGGKRINEIEPTGDTERDFHNAMVALQDDNYEAFIDDLNTLATDQKVANLRDAIIDKFNSPDGVSVQFSNATEMDIRNIHPTQFEVDMEKSLAFPLEKRPEMIDMAFSGKPVIIKDTPLVVAEVDGVSYIIDGHHRWSQIYCLNPDAKMIVRVIKSNMFKSADDVLKLVQMQLFIAKDGGELPQATVDSEYNLYTIDESAFKKWCQSTMSEDAQNTFAKYIEEEPINYLWNNVLVMRDEAQPTPNAHGRGDMPQTDQVDGEYMKPKATPVSENTIEKPTRGHKEMKNEKKEVFTLQVEREDENGEFEVFDAMKYAKTYYSFDDAMEDAKKAYDEYSAIEDRPIEVCITAGEYEMPNGDIYGEPEVIECITAENRGKFDESTKKLNVTKERFEKSRYFQKKYGKLEYVSESGKIFKTDKGLVLEFTDGYEGRSADGRRGSFIDGHQDDPLYGTQGYCGDEPDVDWEADREEYKRSQIKSGVIIRRTNKIGDLWRIETVDSGMRLEENIRGLKKAEKLAKKNGWKIVKTIPKNPEMAKESHKADKAHICPRCGFTGCTVDDFDLLKGDCKEGGSFDANFYCDQCGGTYNVTFGLSIQDIYDTSNDENQEIDLPDSELEDYDL